MAPKRAAGTPKSLWDEMGRRARGEVGRGRGSLGLGMLSLECMGDTQGEMLWAQVAV